MSLRMTAFLRAQLSRVESFAQADGWSLQRRVEATPERNCNGVSVEVFFPTTGEYNANPSKLTERAKIARECDGCPVTDLCLAGALLRGERFGGWGGVAQPDFQELSRIWRRTHKAPELSAKNDRTQCTTTSHGDAEGQRPEVA